ncbi:hypothetical protein A6A04_12105 [Paramagnetospirillum marisnigri]|uniref:Uncharacterized protein n=1 Tax=Paramagnetospirillum marisnigri TaxID=1285242 RepID=A0A178MW08_9PROT|nr:hypothetical protein A6A04_12105 [Paramagnetospirillum marisnigri]
MTKIAYTFCDGCLVNSGGTVMATDQKLVGDLERVAMVDGNVSFIGWAADTGVGEPVPTVLLVSDGKVVGSVVPREPRPDVSAALKLVKKIHFGFDLRVPASELGSSAWVWMVSADGKSRRIDKMFQR